MSKPVNALIALIVAVIVGVGFMMIDRSRGAEWVVSPQQIEQAKAEGKQGYESSPGTVTVLPIRSETADVLPIKWALTGLIAGFLVFRALSKRRTAV
ncbi:hypothetical protein IFT84_16860 [Rhizobium sp. CFBP 8762]|uniref:hypothetical protein n=1 Tax=Rhizobium sp. CFBP 8762 TaxID=2775279 RepID=UPI00177D082D|nr:hypothetical protein [Rhizobium sp. CFBP 8762]MBD8556181.1 hypothetical protein [Rhizobium sp. CFBP 8762]